jgi:hypothetical protein
VARTASRPPRVLHRSPPPRWFGAARSRNPGWRGSCTARRTDASIIATASPWVRRRAAAAVRACPTVWRGSARSGHARESASTMRALTSARSPQFSSGEVANHRGPPIAGAGNCSNRPGR